MSGKSLTSIIVCSYNRADILGDTLGLLLDLTPLEGCDFEVLLVNNNSTDATAELAETMKREHSGHERLRIFFQPEQGLSHARNMGIREARGDLIVFVDDDIIVRDPWLELYQRAFQEHPDAFSFAGKVMPRFLAPRPTWLANDLLGVLAVVDHGGFPRQLDSEHLPMGANMGFTRQCFERYGLFRTDLGRCGTSLFSNEDDEFFGRLFLAGEKVLYLADAVVEHVIPPARLTRSYFRRWKYATGRTTARARGKDPHLKHLFSVPRYMYRNLLECIFRTGWRFLLLDPDRAFHHELRVRYLLGFMRDRLFRRAQDVPTDQVPAPPRLRSSVLLSVLDAGKSFATLLSVPV